MNDAELSAILERCEKASAPPWVAGMTGDKKYSYLTSPSETIWEPVAEIPHDDVTPEGWEEALANLNSIAHAREDLPVVVKELQTARGLLRELEWSGRAYGAYGSTARKCSLCDGIKPGDSLNDGGGRHTEGKGHKEGCRLEAFLSASEGEHDAD